MAALAEAYPEPFSPETKNGERLRVHEGVVLAEGITEHDLEAFQVNPIVDKTVPGLGMVMLHEVRYTGGKKPGQPIRAHRLYTIELDDFTHVLEVTDPVSGKPRFGVQSYPGYTEHITGGFRPKLHSHLSYEFPSAKIVSVETNGLGPIGGRYNRDERDKHSMEAMGKQRLTLARALYGDTPVITVGTSMGSVIEHRGSMENFFGDTLNGAVNIAGRIWITPALVDPEKVATDMAVKFLPLLGVGVAKELVLRSSPRELIGILKSTRKYGVNHREFGALGNQLIELLRGTPEEDVEAVIATAPTVVVGGSNDVVNQWPMMHRLHENNPLNLILKKIPGHGHELAMKPHKTCATLAAAGALLVERTVAA